MTLQEVFLGIIALTCVIMLTGIGLLALTIRNLIVKHVNPVVDEVKSTAENVNSIVKNVDKKADSILTVVEDTAKNVSGKVVSTTDIAHNLINSPLINLTSAMAGIAKAVETMKKPAEKKSTEEKKEK